MNTVTMNISLPPGLKAWIEEQVAKGGYSTASEYFRELARRDRAISEAYQLLEAKLIDGLNSGPSTPMTSEDWDYVRQEGIRRAHEPKL